MLYFSKLILLVGFLLTVTILCVVMLFPSPKPKGWTETELHILQQLRLPEKWDISDPSNDYIHNQQAIVLGKKLFFDKKLSRLGDLSCSSCHQPKNYFTLSDSSDIQLEKQVPILLGSVSFNWFMLDGSADSLWAQALKPLENHIEHNGTRTQYIQYVLDQYPQLYQSVFGEISTQLSSISLPEQASPNSQYLEEQRNWQQLDAETQDAINRVFANMGKALAAYQATLWPTDARFDHFVDQLIAPPTKLATQTSPLFKADEIAGLKLFISERGQCIRCHNGPLFSNGNFHSTLVPSPISIAQQGRYTGIEGALADPFNCLGVYSDSQSDQCRELRFSKIASNELKGATKVPSLRNIAKTGPYMHAGQFTSLKEVLNFYNRAATPFGAHSDLEALKLLPYQLNQLEAFLRTLTEAGTQLVPKEHPDFIKLGEHHDE